MSVSLLYEDGNIVFDLFYILHFALWIASLLSAFLPTLRPCSPRNKIGDASVVAHFT